MRLINILLIHLIIMLSACNSSPDKKEIKHQVFKTEQAFEKMAAEKGAAEAFRFFADSDAVIKRQNDTLIKGKENIYSYYLQNSMDNFNLSWEPDFIDVSASGDLAYSYGNYVLQSKDSTKNPLKSTGVYMTIWKKQDDNTWRFVWD